MSYIHAIITGLSLLTFRDPAQTGIYLNARDFTAHTLSYGGSCAGNACKVKVNAFFGSSEVELICQGKKQVFWKDTVFGYRDCKGQDYRFSGGSAYRILDTAGFYLYTINKLVQGEKIARPGNVYYFSVSPESPLQELTLSNLEKAFAPNAKFRYAMEARFRSDKELLAYDNAGRTYVLKALYQQYHP